MRRVPRACSEEGGAHRNVELVVPETQTPTA